MRFINLFFSSCIGITRDNFEGRRVTRLSYEAYEPMALQELNRLCVDAREKFADIEHIAICHRLGLVFNHYYLEKKRKETIWKYGININDNFYVKRRFVLLSFLLKMQFNGLESLLFFCLIFIVSIL